MTERDAAVHAPRSLVVERLLWPLFHDLMPVPQTFGDRSIRLFVPSKFKEAGDLSHGQPP